jgi:hypothetical protein
MKCIPSADLNHESDGEINEHIVFQPVAIPPDVAVANKAPTATMETLRRGEAAADRLFTSITPPC